LDSVARSLEAAGLTARTAALADVSASEDRLRAAASAWPPEFQSFVAESLHQIEALAGQLRASVELAASSTEAGRRAFERSQAARPARLRLESTLAVLRSNLTLESAAFRHALRLAFSILLAELAARAISGERTYWLPMTAAIVLKPDFTATFTRGVLRVAGTMAGLVLATAVFHFLSPGAVAEVALVGALAFALRCYGPANYGILVTAVTAMIVFLFALSGQPPGEVIAERARSTILGGAIALLVYAVWPTWERSQAHVTLARLLDAYRDYFRAVRVAFTQTDRDFHRELDRARVAARLARSNAEASLERFAAEPGTRVELVQLLASMLASSHRLVHAVMALEAGLTTSRPIPARPAFVRFAYHVELVLHSLSAALRGSPLPAGSLPDLRQDHNELVGSGDPLVERYALVNVEADRITNSLNTLTEQVRDWASVRRNAP
jgi:uncharacterized membrane protein YccC